MNAEPLGQPFGLRLGHRRVAQGSQGVGNALESAPTLAGHTLKGT